MANESVTITLTARDGASQTFKTVGRSAEQMGTSVDQAGQKSTRSFAGMQKGALAVGAGIGTLAGAISIAGKASLDQEQSIRALERSYGDASAQIVDFTNAIQDNTTFSNESAREAASTAASLARNYGFTADEIEQLITISADLAAVNGTTLEDATQRTVAAMRGEAESAEALGLTLNQAAIDHEGLTLTMSQEEAAHFRLNALVEQSAFAQGAAGDAAATTAGHVKQLTNEVQDQIVRFGEWSGVSGEVLGSLSQFALLGPAVGAVFSGMATAIGALAPNLTKAAASAALFNVALGPVGLAALAIGAGIALYELAGTAQDDFVPAMYDAAAGAAELDQTVRNLIETSSFLAPMANDVKQSFDTIGAGVADYEARLAAAQKEAADFQYIPSPDPKTIEEYTAHQDHAADTLAALEAEQAKALISEEKLSAARAAANHIITASGEAAHQSRLELANLTEDVNSGKITWNQYVDGVIGVEAIMDQLGLALNTTRDQTDGVTAATEKGTDAYNNYVDAQGRVFGRVDIVNQLREQAAARLDETDAVDAAADALTGLLGPLRDVNLETAAAATAGAIIAPIVDPGNLIATNALLKEQQGAYYGLRDGIQSAGEAQAVFKQTQDDLIASQDPFTHQLSEYNTQLGYLTDAEDLLNQRREDGIALTAQQEDFLARVDAAQARLTGGTEDATLALGEQALQYAENMKIGDEMNDKLGTQNDLTGELNNTILALIAALEGIPGYVSSYIDVNAEDAKLQADHIKNQLDAIDGRTSYASVIITGYYTGPNVGYTMPGGKLGGVIPEGNRIGHAQHGAAMRGWSWVGEAGPELIHAPGARVLPHTASVAATQGKGGTSIVVQHMSVYANDPEQFLDAMRAYTYAGER